MTIKAVGFDFDDTLVSTEGGKDEIIVKVICNLYGIKKGIKPLYKTLKGRLNRRDKLKKILTKVLKRKPTKKEIDKADRAFSKRYRELFKTCPLFKCTNILRELKNQVDFTFLLSLEKRTDVLAMAKHCGVKKYFDEVLGGPKSKMQNFKHVLKKHKIKPKEAIYVGDRKNDIIVSKRLGIKSIGIQKDFNYRKLLKKLGADFTFSSLCAVPFRKIIR
ncbi:HAD family hydrolase [Nanoarchaeota archaeon]